MEYLIKEDASKKCQCCKTRKYSIEFADSELFTDGKAPVCSTCARSQKLKQKVSGIMAEYDAMAICKKCDETKNLADFIARAGDWYKITNVCIDCRSQRFNR